MTHNVEKCFEKLKVYCEQEGYRGWDPYDGLNSQLFQWLPIRSNRLARLVWIQFFKKSPLNFRKLVRVEKDFNPKALGLFISGYCNLYKIKPEDEYLEIIALLAKRVESLSTKGWSGACWGYNFDWQSRLGFTPKYSPTVVTSTFIGCALLDAYDILGDQNIKEVALSTGDFILQDLDRKYDDKGNFGFSYGPRKQAGNSDFSVVFNASLLGSRMLSRIYKYTGNENLLKPAKKSVEFCLDHQMSNGAWAYGTHKTQQWIDNFHTGYNLECLQDYWNYSGDASVVEAINKGYEYYVQNFFTQEGQPKYYHNTLYPIDIHTSSQLIITAFKLNKFQQSLTLIDKVLDWTLSNMQDKSGYFYFQLNKYVSSKIPYMRWSQAWMFYSLSYYLLYKHRTKST